MMFRRREYVGYIGIMGVHELSPLDKVRERVKADRFHLNDAHYRYGDRWKSASFYMQLIQEQNWRRLSRYIMFGNFGSYSAFFQEVEPEKAIKEGENLDNPKKLIKLFDNFTDRIDRLAAKQELRINPETAVDHTYHLSAFWRCQCIIAARLYYGDYHKGMLDAVHKPGLAFCGPVVSQSYIANTLTGKTLSTFVLDTIKEVWSHRGFDNMLYYYMPIFQFLSYIEPIEQHIASGTFSQFMNQYAKLMDDSHGSYKKLAEALAANRDLAMDKFDKYALMDMIIDQLKRTALNESSSTLRSYISTNYAAVRYKYSRTKILANLLKMFYEWRDRKRHQPQSNSAISLDDARSIHGRLSSACDLETIRPMELWALLNKTAKLLKMSDEFIIRDKSQTLKDTGKAILEVFGNQSPAKWRFLDMTYHIDDPYIDEWLADLSKTYDKPISPLFLILLLIYVDIFVLGNQQETRILKEELFSWCGLKAEP